MDDYLLDGSQEAPPNSTSARPVARKDAGQSVVTARGFYPSVPPVLDRVFTLGEPRTNPENDRILGQIYSKTKNLMGSTGNLDLGTVP